MRRIYLDHNAGSPPLPEALQALDESVRLGWANPASAHAEGRQARSILDRAREQVAALAGVPPSWVVFTSGGTEAAHAALRGVALAAEAPGEVVISGMEHAAVRAAAAALEPAGLRTVMVPPGRDGVVDAERFIAACGPRTRVAALILAHNEIGTIQPVAPVAEALAAIDVPLVVDAVQGAGRLDTLLPAAGDVLGVLSAAKMGGLAGAGALLADPDRPLVPLLGGGEQERGRRGGTPSLALVAAMGAAAAAQAGAPAWLRVQTLRDDLESWLGARFPALEFPGRGRRRLPNTSAMLAPGVLGEDVVAALDLEGVAVSSGSACATGSARASDSLLAMGYGPDMARGLVRLSLGPATTSDDMALARQALEKALPRLLDHARCGVARP